jgi:hypothetical protein
MCYVPFMRNMDLGGPPTEYVPEVFTFETSLKMIASVLVQKW